MKIFFVLLIAAVFATCEKEEGIGEPPVDFNGIKASFSSPTGVYDQSTEKLLMKEIEELSHLYEVFEKIYNIYPDLKKLLSGAASQVSGALSTVSSPLTTYGYIKYSCPGADMKNPALDFKKGMVKIESDELKIENNTVSFNGYLKMLFEECLIEGDLLKGVSHILVESDGAVLDFELEDFTGETLFADFRVSMIVSAEKTSFLAYVGGYSFVVDFSYSSDGITASIKASNGQWSCEITQDSVKCDF
ncbi:MAG: hypothetical protein FJ088_03235 [Deltaproteobacteria bacterium]|nr:hypothetical protein [Deltaproteobacteria bacterium]